jgi:hypothetical protein
MKIVLIELMYRTDFDGNPPCSLDADSRDRITNVR